MTHFNSKEEAFKDLLSELDFDLDTNDIWNAIEDELPRKEKKPKLLWGLSFLVLGLLATALIHNPSAQKVEVYANEDKINDYQPSNELPSTKALETAIDVVAERKASNEQKETFTNNQNKKVINNNTSLTAQHQPIIARTTYHSYSQPAQPMVQNNFVITKNNVITKSSSPTSLSQKSGLENLAILNSLAPNVKGLDSQEILKPNFLFSEAMPIEVSAKKSWTPYYHLLSGPSKNLSQFSSNEASKIKAYESDLIGLSSQLTFGMENGTWNVFAGVRHSYNASRFSNHGIDSETEDKPIETLHILASGETESRAGFISETTVTQNAIDWHRVHQNIDLQLGLGRRVINLKSMTMSLEAAVNYNIWSSASGYYYSDDFNQITKFSAGQSNPYNKSNGLGAQLNMNIEYQLSGKASLVLKPFVNKYFNPITEESLSYQIKNSQIGLQIGISYRPTGSIKKTLI